LRSVVERPTVIRRLVAAFALVELLIPERIVDAGERLAFRNPGECALRSWTIPIARLEAIAFWYVARRGGAPWTRFQRALGLVGLPAALAARVPPVRPPTRLR